MCDCKCPVKTLTNVTTKTFRSVGYTVLECSVCGNISMFKNRSVQPFRQAGDDGGSDSK